MKKIKKKWQCQTCKLKFTYESQLSRHQSTHTYSKPYKCTSKTCPKSKEGFKSQQALDRHMDIHKGNLIKCNVQGCPKSFTTHHYLRDHKNMAHGLPYECKHVLDGCTFTCKSRKTLSDHHKLYCPFNLDRFGVK